MLFSFASIVAALLVPSALAAPAAQTSCIKGEDDFTVYRYNRTGGESFHVGHGDHTTAVVRFRDFLQYSNTRIFCDMTTKYGFGIVNKTETAHFPGTLFSNKWNRVNGILSEIQANSGGGGDASYVFENDLTDGEQYVAYFFEYHNPLFLQEDRNLTFTFSRKYP